MVNATGLAVGLLVVGLAVGAAITFVAVPLQTKTTTLTSTITSLQQVVTTLTQVNSSLIDKVSVLQSELYNLTAALADDNVEQVLIGQQFAVPQGSSFSQSRISTVPGWHVLTVVSSTSSNTMVEFSFGQTTETFDVGSSGSAAVYIPAGDWSYSIYGQSFSTAEGSFNLWFFYQS
jgi:hypothetical protein